MAAGSSMTPTDSMRGIRAERFTDREARRLLWRAGFGGTPEQVRTLASWGPERAVDFLLDTDSIEHRREDDDSFADDIMVPLTDAEREEYRRARREGDEETVARFRARRQNAQRADRRQMAAMQRWWLARMIESPKPLEEKMTLFWHGHFVSAYRAVENSHHMLLQNGLFRSHALGSFSALMRGVIRDPAMLEYLDNARSRRRSPNENLARELLELFSLGVGNYTERDIKEGARALTGYSYDGNEFVFRRAQHDGGQKEILGVRGRLDGDGFVDAILGRQSCSEFLCWKLYRYFVADIPPDFRRAPATAQRVILKMAATMRRENYAVRPVLRELFLSEHFYDPAIGGAKIKSPVELVVGAVRSAMAPARSLGVLVDALDLMGQDLFHPPNVAGWAGGRAWINTSTLFARQNSLTYLLTGETPGRGARGRRGRGSLYEPGALTTELGAPASDPVLLGVALLDHLLGEAGPEMRPQRERLVIGILDSDKGSVSSRVGDAVSLITALPEHQLC